jgi:peptidoglycan hydrolase CwlO-like protein
LNSALNELTERKTKVEAQVDNCEAIYEALNQNIQEVSTINSESEASLQNFQNFVQEGL